MGAAPGIPWQQPLRSERDDAVVASHDGRVDMDRKAEAAQRMAHPGILRAVLAVDDADPEHIVLNVAVGRREGAALVHTLLRASVGDER